MIEVTSKLAKMWNELDDNDKEYWKSKETEENSKVLQSSIAITAFFVITSSAGNRIKAFALCGIIMFSIS